MDRWVLIPLGVWALLTGLFLVTNIRVEYGQVVMGTAALVTGAVCIVRALR